MSNPLNDLSTLAWFFFLRLVLPLGILYGIGWLVWRYFAPQEAAERHLPFERFVFRVRELPRLTLPQLSPGMILTLLGLALLWIVAGGFLIARMFWGLSAATALSDTVPWGLWIAFKLSCVAVAAGGFTLAGTVYVFHLERYRPIVRPAVLVALLGYTTFVISLVFDLGRWYNIWHPIVMWNPHSVMFEIAWCVMLYLAVLYTEFSPALFERLHMKRAVRVTHKITLPVVIAGIILSTLHQSSLGSLYLIMETRLDPFWHSALLPVFFFISAIGAGLAMLMIVGPLSARYLKSKISEDLLASLARPAAIVLGIYLLMKVGDLYARGMLPRMLTLNTESLLIWSELLIGVVIPIALFLTPAGRNNPSVRFRTAWMVIVGTVLNRTNVSLFGLMDYYTSRGVNYVPSFGEWSITLGLLSAAIVAYILAVKFLPVMPEPRAVEVEA